MKRFTRDKCILKKLVDELRSMKNGEVVDLVTDALEGLRSDFMAWSRAIGNVQIVEPMKDAAMFDRHLIWKASADEVKGGKIKSHVATIVLSDGLLDPVSPLRFALAAITSGVKASLYLQGLGVKPLKKDFKGLLWG